MMSAIVMWPDYVLPSSDIKCMQCGKPPGNRQWLPDCLMVSCKPHAIAPL